MRLMRIPVTGGIPQAVLETRNGWPMCANPPASQCVIQEESQDGKVMTLTAFDPLRGRGKVIRSLPTEQGTDVTGALSSDGNTFAISANKGSEIHVHLFSLSGGPDRQFTVKGWSNLRALNWSSDGKGLYGGSISADGIGTLLYVDLQGNARVVWQHNESIGGVWGIPSPDGRFIAIAAIVVNSNVWMKVFDAGLSTSPCGSRANATSSPHRQTQGRCRRGCPWRCE